MQDVRYTLKLADEDKRWMTFPGLAETGVSQLPALLQAQDENRVDAPSVGVATEPPSGLSLALANASLHIQALTEEQVRLRESLETLNGTLFIAAGPLGAKAGEATAEAPKAAPEDKVSAAESWLSKSSKWGAESLLDTVKSRVSGKVVDATLGRLPYVGQLFRDDSKDCCCPGAKAPLTGRARYAPKKTARQKGTGRSSPPVPRKSAGSGRSTNGPMAIMRGLGERAGKAFDGLKTGLQARVPSVGPSLRRLSTRALSTGKALRLKGASALGLRKASASRLSPTLTRLGTIGARTLAPLRYADAAISIVQGVRRGDRQAVGGGLGTAGGAWAGASAGAALGTLVFPGVGTAVGGVIGGLLGGEGGSWLGEKLFGPSDRLPSPDAVSKELTNARSDNVQVTLAPSIQITGVNPADAQQVVDRVLQSLQNQCVPMLTDSLAVRRNAALTDGGD
ncbi:phage tail tape measure protein, TP901 family [Pseudomonas fluorescens]|uniref:Phage tail tape measure protein, TP901 family n=1 Tax=Pseudomonas fluorescens TaxID=294 RepID=A0A379II72_PSEFL|nr:hypothetical protein [Pseudomonas fluorescens]AIG02692.1 hypothetical protein HZ99_11190 [Pseudomonas fluorescens]SUD33096.1 phage tail tape measure protein, TP901 family [Pseudomonas fluorescens]